MWHSPDPLEQYESGYVYAGNNPILMNDPSGMWAEQSTYVIASTFVDNNNKVIWHIDDGDNNVYKVSDEKSWIKGGRKKDGLDVVGEEDPQRNYTVGSHYDFYISPNTLFWIETFRAINKSLDFWSDFFGGPSGENVNSIAKVDFLVKNYAFAAILKAGEGLKLAKKLTKYGKNGKMPTPELNPEQFKPVGDKLIHKETGAFFSKSHTSHGNAGNTGTQWKAWPKGTTDFGSNSKKAGKRISIDYNGNVVGN